MIAFELWMVPAAVILTALGLVTAGYVWGMVLDIKHRLTNGTSDTE